MVRTSLLITTLFALLFGACAKKQVVKPTEPTTRPGAGSEADKQEPSIRFNDWQVTPELRMIYFGYDSSELDEVSRNILKKNAQYIESHPEFNVLIEGYCDERGTIEYNLALGQRRASVVREYYGQLGIPLAKIGTLSYGEENPVDQGHNEAAWSKNRRVITKVRTGK